MQRRSTGWPRLKRLIVYYLVVVGVVSHVLAIALVILVVGVLGYSPGELAAKMIQKVRGAASAQSDKYERVLSMLGVDIPGRRNGDGIGFPSIRDWNGQGASRDGRGGRIPASLRVVTVETASELTAAISASEPGDAITLAPGTYFLTGRNVPILRPGTEEKPIVVRAERLGDAVIEFDALEGFLVARPFWVFENLEIVGVCADHSDCEHAFHIVGEARRTVVRNNRILDFNAAIKGNCLLIGDKQVCPDDVIIERNSIANSSVRETDNPVTPIDVVAASGWIVRGNLIADFVKGRGDQISYAGFFKGNSRDAIFERNLVICGMGLVVEGVTQVGLSFGGGGSGNPSTCRDGRCLPEHTDGVIRNNVIMHCNDVGIYLNQANNTSVVNNTLYNTVGIDVRFSRSTAIIANNLLSGRIKDRDGGTSTLTHNLSVSAKKLRRWFADPDVADFSLRDGRRFVDRGVLPLDVEDDFCGVRRTDGQFDIGAIEYSEDLSCSPSNAIESRGTGE